MEVIPTADGNMAMGQRDFDPVDPGLINPPHEKGGCSLQKWSESNHSKGTPPSINQPGALPPVNIPIQPLK